MSKKQSKIILYKEDVDGMDLASSAIRSEEIIDSMVTMQTDFVPKEATVQVNQDGNFIACQLTESESKKIANMPEVIAVVDDVEVRAIQEEMGPSFPDAEDVQALADIQHPTDIDDADIDPQQYQRFLQHYPAMGEDQIQIEQQLIDQVTDASIEPLQSKDMDRKKIVKLVRCILNCLQDNAETDEATVAQIIEATLLSEGFSSSDVSIAADVILWNIRLIYANLAWRFSRGSGVRVAVVDTGIANRHPDLRVYGGVSYVPGVTSWNDDNGHGTHVAGIIAARSNGRGIIGVAPEARLYAVKVLDRNGSGVLSSVLNGLMWCGRTRMHIVNLSLGNVPNPDNFSLASYNAAYEHVGSFLRRRYGTLLVAAAGNRGGRPVSNPARCPSYLAVGSIDNQRRLAPYSSIGYQVELCAPGSSILSTFPPNTYGTLSGTSMAAPHVTGVAALVKSRWPAMHGDSIRVRMNQRAIDLGWPGRDWAWGYGQVHALRSVQ